MNEALEAIQRHLDEEEKRQGIVRVPAPRDWVPCRWCGGSAPSLGQPGCLACFNAREKRKKELDEEYARQFPNGPQPIFTARADKPEEMEALKRVFHREKLEQAFGPGGGGIDEVLANAKREMDARAE